MKPITQSKTTRNQVGGAVATGGPVAAVLFFVRTSWPDLLPWPVEGDAALVAFCTTTLAPLVSRLAARILDHK